MAVTGDVAQTCLRGASSTALGDVAAGHRDTALRGLAQPSQDFDELVLAVPRDPGDAKDLPGPDLEAHATHGIVTTVVARPQVGYVQNYVAGMRFPAIDNQLDLAPDHQLGELVLVRVRGLARTDDL